MRFRLFFKHHYNTLCFYGKYSKHPKLTNRLIHRKCGQLFNDVLRLSILRPTFFPENQEKVSRKD